MPPWPPWPPLLPPQPPQPEAEPQGPFCQPDGAPGIAVETALAQLDQLAEFQPLNGPAVIEGIKVPPDVALNVACCDAVTGKPALTQT